MLQISTQNNIFVYENFTSIEHLKELAKPLSRKVDSAGKQLAESTITATHILAERPKDFKKICERVTPTMSAHLISHHNGNLVWQKTIGNGIKSLQPIICDENLQTEIGEEAILETIEKRNERAFIISDSPGMGKSVLLANLARKTRKQYAKGLVFYFVMVDFIVSVIKEQRKKGQSQKILDIIIQEEIIRNCSNYQLKSSIITAKESPPLFIFFDGLDELSSDVVPLAIECFHRIKKLFSRARLHVTTRPHLMHQLENSLQTFGYNIQPFNQDDQVEFLTKQWLSIRHEPKLVQEKLQELAKQCLLALEKSLSISQKTIAGIPLQCLLIAQVFSREAEEFADPENQHYLGNSRPKVHVKSITELYEKLVNRKFDVFQRVYLPSSRTTNTAVALRNLHVYISIQSIMSGSGWAEKLRFKLLSAQTYSALKLILPKWTATLEEFQAGVLPRGDILSMGILQEIDPGHWSFIHRTFAEYFIAVFVADCLSFMLDLGENFSAVRQFFEKAVLETVSCKIVLCRNFNMVHDSFKFKYPVICHFLNTMLTPKPLFIPESNLDHIREACINESFINMYKTFTREVNKQQRSKWRTSILLAAHNSQIEMLQWMKFNRPVFQQFYLTVLHIALEHGHKDLVFYVLNDCVLEDLIQGVSGLPGETDDHTDAQMAKIRSILPDIDKFLPFCLANTSDQGENIVSSKIDIIKILHKFFLPAFHSDIYQNKPLLAPNIHIDLLLYMMKCVESDELIDEKDESERTVLCKAAEYLSAQNFQKLLETLSDNHTDAFNILVKSHDEFNQTPLQYIFRHLDVTQEILEIFSKHGADMCSVDKTGYNILFNAIRHQRSLQVIQKLLDYNKDHCDKYKRNALHIAAQHAIDQEVIKYLLLQGFNKDSEDCFGNTPIFYAMRNRNQFTNLQFSTILVSLKPSNLNHVNSIKETVADLAKKLENLQAQNILRQLRYST